jgi:hypothetical protein
MSKRKEDGISKKKLAAIIVACVIAIIVIIVLFSIKPWERTYMLSVSVVPSQAGFVSPSGGEYESGAQVTLTAIPASGYTFDCWRDHASSSSNTVSSNTFTITMNAHKGITAYFLIIPEVPEVLFSDDFSDESSGWVTYDEYDGRVAYLNGRLYVKDYTYPEETMYSECQRYFTNFILEVETWLVDGTDENWHSVGCRWQDEENNYSFGIGADGYYAIVKWIDGSQVPLTGSTPRYSSHINQGIGAVNLIYIECIGSKLSLSVNGHLLWEGTDATFSGGDITLSATALAGTYTEVAFDNIVVSDVDVHSDIADELATANGEAENVKTAELAYYADAQVWPDDTTSSSGNYSFTDYYAGTLKASYSFDDDGFINGVGDPGGFGGGTTSYMYPGIHWENPVTIGHGQWVVDY